MYDEISDRCEALEASLARLEPGVLSGANAARMLRRMARVRHSCAEAEGRLARRVDASNVWRQGGHRSAAHFVASNTGESVGAAASSLETAERLESFPATAEQYRAGRLSPGLAGEIADAATAAPDAERDLLLTAATKAFSSVRDQCRRTKAAATDQVANERRTHTQRSLRDWTDAGGVWHLHARGTTTDGGRIMAAIKAETDRVFNEARAAGRRESHEAYAFDALTRLVERTGGEQQPGPNAHVHVNVDVEPLLAGQAMPGKTCEIPGIGPISIESARTYLGDALLTIVLAKGVDVTTIAHHGRTIPTAIRRALEARDEECVVATCSVRDHLDNHHLERWVDTGVTTLDGVVRICRWEHYLVTHCGSTLEPRGEGSYDLVPPEPSSLTTEERTRSQVRRPMRGSSAGPVGLPWHTQELGPVMSSGRTSLSNSSAVR